MKPKFRNLFLCLGSALLSVSSAHAADGTWTATTAGPFLWSAGGNWSSGVADGADSTAFFTSNISAEQVIALDSARSIGNITFTDSTSNTNNWTISNNGSALNILTLDVTTGAPIIDVTQSNRRVTISAQIAGNDGLTKNGGGHLILSNNLSSYTGATTVNGGILDFNTIANANIGGGVGVRDITVGSGAAVRFTALSNAFLNRIVETTDEFAVMTGTTSNALDFSSATGANLSNAFLSNNLTNGGKTEISGTLTFGNGNYRLGYTTQNGALGILQGSLLSGSNGLIVGGRVSIVGTHTFSGDTVIRDGARLGLAGYNLDVGAARNNSLALQNSVLDLGAPSATGQLFIESAQVAGFITGSTTGLNGSTTSATFGGLKGSRDLISTFLFTGTGNNTSAQPAAFINGFTLNTGSGVDVAYSGAIGGFGGAMSLTKTGVGTQELAAANTYAGVTTISNGTLKIGNNKALGSGGLATGSTTGATTINGGTLDLNGQTGVVEPITLNGNGNGGNGALVNNSGSPASIVSGLTSLNLSSATSGTAYSAAPTVSISGTGSGATAVASMGLTTASIGTISAGGTGWSVGDLLTVNGGNGTGAMVQVTSVSAGVITGLSVIQAGSGYTAAPTSLSRYSAALTTGGTLTVAFNATNFTVSSLQLTNAGTGYDNTTTYTFGSGNATAGSVLHSAVTLESDSSIGGSGDISIGAVVSETGGSRALTKLGNGKLTLSNTNTYTGATSVNGGTLEIAAGGSTAAGSAVTVSNSGSALIVNGTVNGTLTANVSTTISGTGTIVGNATISGTHNPGNSPGIQTFGGDLAYTGGSSVVNWELSDNTITNAANPNAIYDQIIVGGNLDFTATTTINLAFNGAGSGVLWADSLWDTDQSWTIYDVTGLTATTTNFSNLSLVSINWLDSGGNLFSTTGGSFALNQVGNDVVLNYTLIPEPSAALLGALGLLVLLRRRR